MTFAAFVFLGVAVVCMVVMTWSYHCYLHRGRRGIAVIGKPVEFDEHMSRFDVNIARVTQSMASPERELHLVVVTEGTYVEVNLDDGGELLRKLYDGRAWLHRLEEPSETT